MTWHADASLLARYAAGQIDDARASSVEAHLVACAGCRAAVAGNVKVDRLDAIWGEVEAIVDTPRLGIVERLLRALGVKDHFARLLAATPSLQLSWLLGMSASLAFVVAAAGAGRRQPVLFLVVAPLLPVVGVAAAFGPGLDPTYEVAMAAPLGTFRLLLLRSAAVLATTTLLAGIASFALPVLDWTAGAWLLPLAAWSNARTVAPNPEPMMITSKLNAM